MARPKIAIFSGTRNILSRKNNVGNALGSLSFYSFMPGSCIFIYTLSLGVCVFTVHSRLKLIV